MSKPRFRRQLTILVKVVGAAILATVLLGLTRGSQYLDYIQVLQASESFDYHGMARASSSPDVLCDECKTASVGRHFSCIDRIVRRMGGNVSLEEAQMIVSKEFSQCSQCHPKSCGANDVASQKTTLQVKNQNKAQDQDGATLPVALSMNDTAGRKVLPLSVRIESVSNATPQVVTSPPVASKSPPRKIFTNFYSHIPKAGGTYVFSVLNQLVWSTPEYRSLPPESKYRMCGVGSASTKLFQRRYPYEYSGIKCTIWMSEQPWTPHAQHHCAIVRDPKARMLSQYFFCKEGRHYKYKERMPDTLDEYLETWVTAQDNTPNATLRAESLQRAKSFVCWGDPRNLQSRFTGFTMKDTTSRETLRARFKVLGDAARMTESVCVIAIVYGGGAIPSACNCSHLNAENRQLTLSKVQDHGVKHHGDTFATTPQQEAWIAQLTDQDVRLYAIVQELFDQQVNEIEARHGIQLCRKFA